MMTTTPKKKTNKASTLFILMVPVWMFKTHLNLFYLQDLSVTPSTVLWPVCSRIKAVWLFVARIKFSPMSISTRKRMPVYSTSLLSFCWVTRCIWKKHTKTMVSKTTLTCPKLPNSQKTWNLVWNSLRRCLKTLLNCLKQTCLNFLPTWFLKRSNFTLPWMWNMIYWL